MPLQTSLKELAYLEQTNGQASLTIDSYLLVLFRSLEASETTSRRKPSLTNSLAPRCIASSYCMYHTHSI